MQRNRGFNAHSDPTDIVARSQEDVAIIVASSFTINVFEKVILGSGTTQFK